MMTTLMLIFAGLAALLHTLFFCVESVWFISKKLYRRFGVETAEDAEKMRVMAFNQGFYNLFLAIGAVLGIVLFLNGDLVVGSTLILFTCGSMIAAAIVLIISKPELLRAAAIQGLPPLLAVLCWMVN